RRPPPGLPPPLPSAARCWGRAQRRALPPESPILRLTLPPSTSAPQAPPACHVEVSPGSPESTAYSSDTGIGATTRHWGTHWLEYFPAPPSHNRHSAAGDRTAPRYPPGAAGLVRREAAGVEVEQARQALAPAHREATKGWGGAPGD